MKTVTFFFASILFAAPAVASDCPAAPDHSAVTDALIEEIQAATDARSAQIISNDLWQYWADAPDEVSQEILNQGMAKRAAWDLLGAVEDFDRLVAYCPDYAEGYNQRAFANFLRQDFASALPDLERAIELSPRHIGALSGLAMSLIGLGKEAEAQSALAAALALNPWLPERSLLKTPPGQEL